MMLSMMSVPVEQRCAYPHNSHARARSFMCRTSKTSFKLHGYLTRLLRHHSYSGHFSQTKGVLSGRLVFRDSRLKAGPFAGEAFNPMCW